MRFAAGHCFCFPRPIFAVVSCLSRYGLSADGQAVAEAGCWRMTGLCTGCVRFGYYVQACWCWQCFWVVANSFLALPLAVLRLRSAGVFLVVASVPAGFLSDGSVDRKLTLHPDLIDMGRSFVMTAFLGIHRLLQLPTPMLNAVSGNSSAYCCRLDRVLSSAPASGWRQARSVRSMVAALVPVCSHCRFAVSRFTSDRGAGSPRCP